MDGIIKSDFTEATSKILESLNPLEAEILRQSFGIGSEQVEDDSEIAAALEIPVEFVEEYRARALRKLHHPSRSDALHALLEHVSLHEEHVEIIVPKAIEEIGELTPQLVDDLRSKTNNIAKLKPNVFEHLVAELLASRCFYNVKLVGTNKNTSADIFAAKYIDDVGEHRYFIEVKRWKDRIGVEVIDRVYGARISEQSKFGWSAVMIVSIVGFKKFRKYTMEDIHNMGIYLKDKEDLITWLDEYKENENGLYVPVTHKSVI
jgi:restriction endonuclease Mrr